MKTYLKYLLPSLISTLLFSSFALIDGIFIGQRVGDLGLAAINIAWPITAFIQSIGSAIGISAGIYISRLLAKNEIDKANRVKLTAILIMLILAIFFGAVFYLGSRNILKLLQAKDTTLELANEYIRIILIGSSFQMIGCGLIPLMKNSNMVKTAMVLSIISMLTNLLLDYLFIMVLSWGLKGAALASVLGQAVPVTGGLIVYRKELKGITKQLKDIKEIMYGALAPFILTYSYSLIILVTNLFCEKYGSDEAVAAYALLSYLLYISQAISTSTGDAIQPLFSYHNELKNYKITRKYLITCLLVSLGLNVFFALMVIIFRDNLAVLYNLSDKTKLLYNDAINYFVIGFIFLSQFKVVCSYLYSINEKLLANALILFEPIIITPLCYIVFARYYGITGIWFSFGMIQGLLLVLAITLYSYYERRELVYGWIYSLR